MSDPIQNPYDPHSAGPLRIHFQDRGELLESFARAQQESWLVDCFANLEEQTLELRLAPTFPGINSAARLDRLRRIAGGRL